MADFTALVLLALATTATAGTNFTLCPEVTTNFCTINDVRIIPCYQDPTYCRIRRGNLGAVEFDYTPDFNATQMSATLETSYKGRYTKLATLPLDGCQSTTCPVISGEKNKFRYARQVMRIWPLGGFVLKLKLWNPNDQSKICCFNTKVYIKY